MYVSKCELSRDLYLWPRMRVREPNSFVANKLTQAKEDYMPKSHGQSKSNSREKQKQTNKQTNKKKKKAKQKQRITRSDFKFVILQNEH